MHILFVMGTYYPYVSANTVCTQTLISALKKNGNDITVATKRMGLQDLPQTQIQGNDVYTFCTDTDLFYWMQEACGQLKLPSNMKWLHKVCYSLFRVGNKLSNIVRRVDFLKVNERETQRVFAEGIQTLCREKKIDLIVSVSVPFTTHLVVEQALRGMEKKPKWMAYMLDPYGGSEWVCQLYGREKLQAEEKTVFSACDRIMMLNVLKSIYDTPAYEAYKHKMLFLKPTIFDLDAEKETYAEGIEKKPGELALVFAGTLYDNCREYHKVFSALETVAKEMPVHIHFMGNAQPNSLKALKALCSRYPSRVSYYGRMPYAFAKGSMQKADVLINIGNDYTDVIPSKIFEYMAARKPIVHFYRIDEDTALPYLKKYPSILNLDERESPALNGEKLQMFLKDKVSNSNIQKEELEQIYQEDLSDRVLEQFLEHVRQMVK